MQHRVLKYYQVCSNDNLGWPWPILRHGQIWSPVLLYGKKLNNKFFRNGCSLWYKSWYWRSQPNEYMKLYLSVAWPIGVQLLVFFCSSVPVVLFDIPEISVVTRFCRVLIFASSQYLSVIYLFHVIIYWWVRKPPRGPNNCMFWAMIEA